MTEPTTIGARLREASAVPTEAEREAWLLGHIVELRRLVGTAVDRLAELEERLGP